jgi:hypothetical protein
MKICFYPRSIRLVTVIAGIAFLGGCAGFEPVKPPADPNQIMSIYNANKAFTALDPKSLQSYTPLPLPIRPKVEKSETPIEKPKITLPPIPSLPPNLGGAVLGTIGQVSQADTTIDPYDVAGYFPFNQVNDQPGTGHYCTAEFVGDSGDVIMTAGHCVFDNALSAWSRNFGFYLGYNQGNYRQAFDWQCIAIYSGWAQQNYTRDYAFVKVRAVATKALGLKPGLLAQWTSIGYPQNYDGGQRLEKVDGVQGGSADGSIEMRDNPMSHGSSGGAWIGGSNATGLNSHIYSDPPTSMYGPPFDDYTIKLYSYVKNNCLGATPSKSVELRPTDNVHIRSRSLPCLQAQASDLVGGIVKTELMLSDDTQFPLPVSRLEGLFPPPPAGSKNCKRDDLILRGNIIESNGDPCKIKVGELIGSTSIDISVDIAPKVVATRTTRTGGLQLIFEKNTWPSITIGEENSAINKQFGGYLTGIYTDENAATFSTNNPVSGKSACVRVLKTTD